ncbi:hypothetical protein ACOJBO_00095 [Rhizobium beringeri]
MPFPENNGSGKSGGDLRPDTRRRRRSVGSGVPHDNSVPLSGASWMEVTTLLVANSKLTATVHDGRTSLSATLASSSGMSAIPAEPASLLLKRTFGLHIRDPEVGPTTVIGQSVWQRSPTFS